MSHSSHGLVANTELWNINNKSRAGNVSPWDYTLFAVAIWTASKFGDLEVLEGRKHSFNVLNVLIL